MLHVACSVLLDFLWRRPVLHVACSVLLDFLGTRPVLHVACSVALDLLWTWSALHVACTVEPSDTMTPAKPSLCTLRRDTYPAGKMSELLQLDTPVYDALHPHLKPSKPIPRPPHPSLALHTYLNPLHTNVWPFTFISGPLHPPKALHTNLRHSALILGPRNCSLAFYT